MIRFGTDGWRAVIADEFTFENVRRVAIALVETLDDLGIAGPVAVGYDTRFLSGTFAREFGGVLAAHGHEVWLASRPIPTPCLSYATYRFGLACGVMITASHNPPEYNGIKVKARFGGTAPAEFMDAIQSRLERAPRHRTGRIAAVRLFDPVPKYLSRLRELAVGGAISGMHATVVVDPMHGASRGLWHALLDGTAIRIHEVRGDDNPGFGGIGPEPIESNLGILAEAVRSTEADIGIATDGDGDRLGVVDHLGHYVDSHRVFGVLLKQLAEAEGEGHVVVKTVSTTDMIEKLAGPRGMEVVVTPVGFKHIAPVFMKGDVLMGGEESGGFCFRDHLPERDGLLSGLMVLSAMASTGRPLAEMVGGLFDEVGTHCYARLDRRVSGDVCGTLQKVCETPPDCLAGLRVEEVTNMDGTKLRMNNGAWLLMRASGTEPIVRLYAEAAEPQTLRNLLHAGENLIPECAR